MCSAEDVFPTHTKSSFQKKGFTPEQALLVVKAAGLDPAPLEEQIKRRERGHDVAALETRIAELEQRLEAQQSSPKDPDREFAERLASELHRSQSQWYSVGGSGGQNG